MNNSDSVIGQLDGNDSLNNSELVTRVPHCTNDKYSTALNLPIVAAYNTRSLFPKIENFKTDMVERSISVAFVSEIWEKSEDKQHSFEVEKMLEMNGLKYMSKSRPSNKRGGGVALVVNLEKFSCEKLEVFTPDSIEVIWGLLKPKSSEAQFKKIIVCSFYSPPNNGKNTRLADHIVGTLQMLNTKYPESGIILGGDKNKMDLRPILNCGLRLKQVVDKFTRQDKILDVLIMNLSRFYNSPIIAPPIGPDNPDAGKDSDHSVPICIPHTDRFNPPDRTYRLQTYRPLPDSSVRKFGQWITGETWEQISDNLSPSEQVEQFEKLLKGKLDTYCPEKTIKLGSQDKPWINYELKKLHRLRNREYIKRGQSVRYKTLLKEFEEKNKIAAAKYMNKNVDELINTNPGQAYSILKRMGAQPGDCTDSNTFTLPDHAVQNLTNEEAAEKIANHFAEISQNFPPLNIDLLPEHVKVKLGTESSPPTISEWETLEKITAAKKPKSGVPGDLPRLITKEFAVELAVPMCQILNNIFKSAQWPRSWLQEFVTPLAKIPQPESEDDLRPISLTNFFSKVAEHFVVMWLLQFIGDKLDFRQYGGIKGNSITHYIIEFINFVLSNQESVEPTAILACMVDFSKAFNRQNHNVLIAKLSDMGVPAWLLRIVMAFLTERSMVVRYKGAKSTIKSLPGGGPQGTLLGLLLFLVLINDAGFENQDNNAGELITSKKNFKAANKIHLKYVDDMTLAEAVNLKDNLVSVPITDRPQPDMYHARTGHALPKEKSEVYRELLATNQYADANDMKINFKKTKLMLFNNGRALDFMPNLELDGNELEVVEEMKILGLIIRSDMKWSSNTEHIIEKAYKRLWMLRRLKALGADKFKLLDVYFKQVRSVMELAVPAWHPGITVGESVDIERVQRAALHIILGMSYSTYSAALNHFNLETLETRRSHLCEKFSKKAVKHPKHTKWFKLNNRTTVTRQDQPKYCPVVAKTRRFEKSPISYLTSLLNKYSKPGK